jgi:hypothetical protein
MPMMAEYYQIPGWEPIETAPRAAPGEHDIWIVARRDDSLAMLTTWDNDDGIWYTFNLALERGKDVEWRPTHWLNPRAVVALVDDLRRDAERYRYVRNEMTPEDFAVIPAEELDAFIDGEMTRDAETKKPG